MLDGVQDQIEENML